MQVLSERLFLTGYADQSTIKLLYNDSVLISNYDFKLEKSLITLQQRRRVHGGTQGFFL